MWPSYCFLRASLHCLWSVNRSTDRAAGKWTRKRKKSVFVPSLYSFVGAEMAQWWERRLPPMWPGFDSCPVPYVGWVCCLFLSCSEGFFRVQWFSFLHKNWYLQIPVRPEYRTHEKTSQHWCGFLLKYFNYLIIASLEVCAIFLATRMSPVKPNEPSTVG